MGKPLDHSMWVLFSWYFSTFNSTYFIFEERLCTKRLWLKEEEAGVMKWMEYSVGPSKNWDSRQQCSVASEETEATSLTYYETINLQVYILLWSHDITSWPWWRRKIPLWNWPGHCKGKYSGKSVITHKINFVTCFSVGELQPSQVGSWEGANNGDWKLQANPWRRLLDHLVGTSGRAGEGGRRGLGEDLLLQTRRVSNGGLWRSV